MVTPLAKWIIEDWRYKSACRNFQRSPNNRGLPAKVLVNGSPKSGTTWMLRLLSSIPGYNRVDNFRRVVERYQTVKPGDVVHGHDVYTQELEAILITNHIKIVMMVRDPRDQLVSRMFHIKRSQNHAWHRAMQNMTNDEALLLCIEGRKELPGMEIMIKLTQTWLEKGTFLLCVRYEDLLANSFTKFKEVLSYLEISAGDDLIDAIVRHNRFERLTVGRKVWRSGRKPGEEKSNSHFRKGIVGDWKNYLTPEHIQKLKEVAGEQLIALGYEKDFDW
jgi:hypothetical protein